ncbi:unnamed protein product [Orchesella dallaii]|uniref:Uncharacterized protein n=1 Tax=Orchesella dallaii TaxID=48710 RepID=A0ABP1S0T9_9HEXA
MCPEFFFFEMESLQVFSVILLLVLATGVKAINQNVTDTLIELTENTIEEVLNATLDVDDGNIPNEWEVSPYAPRLMEYYNSSSEFLEGRGEPNSCSETFSQAPGAPSLGNVEGIWVTCGNEEETALISYTMRQLEGFRTLNISYYLHAGAVLKLEILGKCYDYSESNSESECEYFQVQNSGRWQQLHYGMGDEPSASFTKFTIKMIVRAPTDYVLIDKVYASVYLPCDENDPAECPRPTTPTIPSTSATTPTMVPPMTSSTTNPPLISSTPFDNCTDTTVTTSELTTTNGTTSWASTTESSTSSEPTTTVPSEATTDEEASTSPSNTTEIFSTTGCPEASSTIAPSAATSIFFLNLNMHFCNLLLVCIYVSITAIVKRLQF